MTQTQTIRIHALWPRSRANGPGERFVVWFQGCTLNCPGCFNPATHDPSGGVEMLVVDVLARIKATEKIEGVTLSGGEPLQQPAALLALLRAIRNETRLPVVLFSGYTLEEVRAQPAGPEILGHIDVLIAGRYVAQRRARGLRGSDNQTLHFLSARFSADDFVDIPPAEVAIAPDGSVSISGVDVPFPLLKKEGPA